MNFLLLELLHLSVCWFVLPSKTSNAHLHGLFTVSHSLNAKGTKDEVKMRKLEVWSLWYLSSSPVKDVIENVLVGGT